MSKTKKTNEQNEEQELIIEYIIQELNKKRKIAINKKEEAILKDETWKYSEDEDTIDYILFIINRSCFNLSIHFVVYDHLFPYRKHM